MSSSGVPQQSGTSHFRNGVDISIEDSTFVARGDASPSGSGGSISFGESSKGMVIKGSTLSFTSTSYGSSFGSPPPPPPGAFAGPYGPGMYYGSPYMSSPSPPFPPSNGYGYPSPPDFYGAPNGYANTGSWPGYPSPPPPHQPPPPPGGWMSPSQSSYYGPGPIPPPQRVQDWDERPPSRPPTNQHPNRPRRQRAKPPSPPPEPPRGPPTHEEPRQATRPVPSSLTTQAPMPPARPTSPGDPEPMVVDNDDPQPSTSTEDLVVPRSESNEPSTTSPSGSTSKSWRLSVGKQRGGKGKSKERTWHLEIEESEMRD